MARTGSHGRSSLRLGTVEHKELYFALDFEDILMLKKMIERAEAKMTSLKTFIKTTNLVDLS